MAKKIPELAKKILARIANHEARIRKLEGKKKPKPVEEEEEEEEEETEEEEEEETEETEKPKGGVSGWW